MPLQLETAPCVRIVVGWSEGDEVPRIVHLYSAFPLRGGGPEGRPRGGEVVAHGPTLETLRGKIG